MIQNSQLIKEYIINICDWVQQEYKEKGNTAFKVWFTHAEEELSILLRDKGVGRRIEKHLKKRGLNPLVKYYRDDDYNLGVINIILQ